MSSSEPPYMRGLWEKHVDIWYVEISASKFYNLTLSWLDRAVNKFINASKFYNLTHTWLDRVVNKFIN